MDEICTAASEKGFKLICFAEHIRQDPDYDVDAFLDEVRSAGLRFTGTTILTGLEAKLLPGGELDCPERLRNEVDVLFLAEHSFPEDFSSYSKALDIALALPQVQVWAHPLLLPLKKGWNIDAERIGHLRGICQIHNVAIEINRRYPQLKTQEVFPYPAMSIRGYDLHDLKDIEVEETRGEPS